MLAVSYDFRMPSPAYAHRRCSAHHTMIPQRAFHLLDTYREVYAARPPAHTCSGKVFPPAHIHARQLSSGQAGQSRPWETGRCAHAFRRRPSRASICYLKIFQRQCWGQKDREQPLSRRLAMPFQRRHYAPSPPARRLRPSLPPSRASSSSYRVPPHTLEYAIRRGARFSAMAAAFALF